jgi:hypothetical protein
MSAPVVLLPVAANAPVVVLNEKPDKPVGVVEIASKAVGLAVELITVFARLTEAL